MTRKERIKEHLQAIADEILAHIREKESQFSDRWVPATEIKQQLDLNYVAVPIDNKQYGPKGWLFAIAARLLEDQQKVEYKKSGSRTFYRSRGV